MKCNTIKDKTYEFNQHNSIKTVSDDVIFEVSNKIMQKNKHVYEKLAKRKRLNKRQELDI